MKNVTITLDNETTARARVKAAERNISLSRYIGEVLREHTRGDDEYERAMRRALAWKPFTGRERYLTREEIYDRAAMRRLDECSRKKGKGS
jgi:hypothetical protein